MGISRLMIILPVGCKCRVLGVGRGEPGVKFAEHEVVIQNFIILSVTLP